MSKLTFSSLPDVCLLLVFDKIALDDLLLNVNLVNRHWNKISAVASQHRKRLVLSLAFSSREFSLIIDSVFTDPFEVSHNKNRYFGGEHDSLIVLKPERHLNSQSIERLVERLPNISTLEVNLFFLPISTSEHLATLINGWREHLVTLKLFTDYRGDRHTPLMDCLGELTNLHSTINSLHMLHHLTYQLDFPFSRRNDDQIEQFTFPISCPSLKKLYFTSNDYATNNLLDPQINSETTKRLFANAFRNYVQSKEAAGLRKATFFIRYFYSLKDYLSTSDVLASKTTHIALDLMRNIKQTKFIDFSRKYYNLTHVRCDIHFAFPIDKLSKCLSMLEHLKHVTLGYSNLTAAEESDEDWLENNNQEADKVKPQMDKITPLTRVKSVYIDFLCLRLDKFLATNLFLNFTFPNLELISIQNKYYNCTRCGGRIHTEERKTTRKLEWHICIGIFLAPIAKCDKLKRIEYWDESDFTVCCSLDKLKLDYATLIH